MLAIAAVTMCLLFIFVDMGQPTRILNVILYPTPRSPMFWDMIVLSGYLVRELRNVVERAALFCRKPKITPEDLPANFRTTGPAPRRAPAQQTTTLHGAVVQAEIEAIRAALARTEGRRSEAADILGVSRKTLWEKMKLHGVESV